GSRGRRKKDRGASTPEPGAVQPRRRDWAAAGAGRFGGRRGPVL
ncbi:MAG: hypothetical protein AVDCRST_MAG15-959, partial [uncultured Rubellimicrobium sp.]